jgi:hypothetical protein
MATTFWETMTLVLTRRDAKTPMAFYNRCLLVITALGIGPLYSNVEVGYKHAFLIVAGGLFVALMVWVSVFAWMKPEFLLYGAEAHLEKLKFSFASGQGATGNPPPAQAIQ